MKTKYKRNAKNPPRNPALDLFEEIPVTWDEIYWWGETVAGIEKTSWRLPWYIRGWNVADKIRAAKLAGTFQPEFYLSG